MGEALPDYSGMTTNERLSAAGLTNAWDRANESGSREGAIGVLRQVEREDHLAHVVDTVLADPGYGFPRTP